MLQTRRQIFNQAIGDTCTCVQMHDTVVQILVAHIGRQNKSWGSKMFEYGEGSNVVNFDPAGGFGTPAVANLAGDEPDALDAAVSCCRRALLAARPSP